MVVVVDAQASAISKLEIFPAQVKIDVLNNELQRQEVLLSSPGSTAGRRVVDCLGGAGVVIYDERRAPGISSSWIATVKRGYVNSTVVDGESPGTFTLANAQRWIGQRDLARALVDDVVEHAVRGSDRQKSCEGGM